MIMENALAHEIDSKLEKIRQNPDYYLKRDHVIRHALDRSLRRFSWWIEHPDIRREVLVERNRKKKGALIRRARRGIRDLGSAWKYISVTSHPFETPHFLEVGKRVEPRLNSRGYREARVSLNLPGYTPPNHVKIPLLVEGAFRELFENEGKSHIVESAAQVHLRLAGIQPFPNGNKRVARLYQDKLLYDNDLPPAVIPIGEREVYIDLLEQGLISLGNGTTTGRKMFFDYVGGKVNTALDEILGDLNVKVR